jgi:1-acyl-sn-glycerol-3-phosphate acyltransferase
MYLEQIFPRLFGKRHGTVERMDMRSFRQACRELELGALWFRPTLHGVEYLPPGGGALLVGNHGPLGIDAPFLIKGIYEECGRCVRALADRMVFRMPLLRVLAARFGAIEGEPEQALHLLEQDNFVLVYPGGVREAARPPHKKYELSWDGHYGFVKVALRASRPIIPIACVGMDDTYFQLADQEQMRHTPLGHLVSAWIGEKYVPPIYAGLGPLPIPRRFDYHIGPPIDLGHGPEAAEDMVVVHACHARVKRELQGLIRDGLEARADRQRQLRRHVQRRSGQVLRAAARRARTHL